MKKTITVTLTLTVDPEDFKDDDTKEQLSDEAIRSTVSDELHDDLNAALDNYDYEVGTVTIADAP